MTFLLYVHVGYLVGYDQPGVSLGWGSRPYSDEGATRFKWSWEKPFPWWMQRREIESWWWSRKYHRMEARAEKKRRAS